MALRRSKSSQRNSSTTGEQNAKSVLSIVCDIISKSGGTDIELSQLLKSKRIKVKSKEQMILFLRRWSSLFELLEKQDSRLGNNWVFVRPKSDVQLCPVHANRGGSCIDRHCRELHICRFFISGSDRCSFGGKCHFGHDLQTPHNYEVLRLNLLDELSDDHLRLVMGRASTGETTPSKGGHYLPKICSFYNAGPKGCQKNVCPFLHLCKHFIDGDCKFGTRCKRSHDLFQGSTLRILQSRGLDPMSKSQTEVLGALREGIPTGSSNMTRSLSVSFLQNSPPVFGDLSPRSYGGLVASMQHGGARPKHGTGYQVPSLFPFPSVNIPRRTSDSTSDKAEICSYFLTGKCHYGERCRNHHPDSKLPYQWQTNAADGTGAFEGWEDAGRNTNLELETAYCDPQNADADILIPCMNQKATIEFDSFEVKMNNKSCDEVKIRRLSTPSSGQPGRSISTDWKWYWLDNGGGWLEYGSQGEHGRSSISSKFLEEKLHTAPSETLAFNTDQFKYSIDLQAMKQRNISVGTERDIRRRPAFVSPEKLPQKIQLVKKSWSNNTNDQGQGQDFPSHWKPVVNYDDGYCKVPVDKSGDTAAEFKEIEDFVMSTLATPFAKVVSMERVQNPELHDRFEREKSWMVRKSSAPPSSLERRLFHGTRQKYLNAICQQGFDFRVSGMSTGTKYGKGSYFSVNAAYSRNYSDSNELIVARVLTGDYTSGNSTLTRPPVKDANRPGVLFDSCVDQTASPTMFIVFRLDQAYPEYIVKLE